MLGSITSRITSFDFFDQLIFKEVLEDLAHEKRPIYLLCYKNTRLIYCDQNFASIFGYTNFEMYSRSAREFLYPETQRELIYEFAERLKTQNIRAHAPFLHRRGHHIWMNLKFYRCTSDKFILAIAQPKTINKYDETKKNIKKMAIG